METDSGSESAGKPDAVNLLIEKSREGDRIAQSELSRHVEQYLSIMIERKLDNSLRANFGVSDIVQQTLMQMVKGIGGFRGGTTKEFFGWLNRIIENETAKANRHLKQQKRDVRRRRSLSENASSSGRPFEYADYFPTPCTQAISNEQLQLFDRALEQIPDDYANVIRLRNLEQLSFKQVAEKMGRSVDSVSNLWYRAILKFQHELEKLDGNSQ